MLPGVVVSDFVEDGGYIALGRSVFDNFEGKGLRGVQTAGRRYAPFAEESKTRGPPSEASRPPSCGRATAAVHVFLILNARKVSAFDFFFFFFLPSLDSVVYHSFAIGQNRWRYLQFTQSFLGTYRIAR